MIITCEFFYDSFTYMLSFLDYYILHQVNYQIHKRQKYLGFQARAKNPPSWRGKLDNNSYYRS